MTISDYIARLQQTRQNLISQRQKESLIMAFDLLSLIKIRIQSRGENYKGSQFAPYTLPYAKRRATGFRRRGEKNVNRGYQIKFVDFTVSGGLWADIRPQVVSNDTEITKVLIKGSKELTADILSGQARYRGNILTPSQMEIDLTQQANIERLQKALEI